MKNIVENRLKKGSKSKEINFITNRVFRLVDICQHPDLDRSNAALDRPARINHTNHHRVQARRFKPINHMYRSRSLSCHRVQSNSSRSEFRYTLMDDSILHPTNGTNPERRRRGCPVCREMVQSCRWTMRRSFIKSNNIVRASNAYIVLSVPRILLQSPSQASTSSSPLNFITSPSFALTFLPRLTTNRPRVVPFAFSTIVRAHNVESRKQLETNESKGKIQSQITYARE